MNKNINNQQLYDEYTSILNSTRSIDLIHPKVRMLQKKYLLEQMYQNSWERYFTKCYQLIQQQICSLHPFHLFLLIVFLLWITIIIYEYIKKIFGIKSRYRENEKIKQLAIQHSEMYPNDPIVDPNDVLTW